MVSHARPLVMNMLRKHMNFVSLRQLLHQGNGVALSATPSRRKMAVEYSNAQSLVTF